MLLLETARPKQWVKNAFVLAAMVFSGNAFDLTAEVRVWSMVAAFCLASSATYLLNDAVDAAADRLNPRTAHRPIARGDLSPATALVAAATAGLAALSIAFVLSWQSGAVVSTYIALQLGYSLGLKHVPLIDIMVIALGFVLRALGGSVAIPVEVSDWLLVCTGLLALLLGLGKRRGELASVNAGRASARTSIDGYTIPLVDQLIVVASASIVVSYSIYSVTGSEARLMGVTIPFVVYGVMRLLQVIQMDEKSSEDPSALILRDRPLQFCVMAWGATALVLSSFA